jgi:hypothetical protein
MINPYDLGSIPVVTEYCQKVNINELIRRVNSGLKQSLIQCQPELSGVAIAFKTSRTRFNGERLWFSCPSCSKRVGKLFRTSDNRLSCRICLGAKYRKNRYKNMAEIDKSCGELAI